MVTHSTACVEKILAAVDSENFTAAAKFDFVKTFDS